MIARVTVETDQYVFVAERVVVTGPIVTDDKDLPELAGDYLAIKRVKHRLIMDNEILENDEGVVYTITDKKRVGRNRRGYEYGG